MLFSCVAVRNLFILPLISVNAVHQGSLLIKEDGKTTKVHVAALSESGKLFKTRGSDLKLRWGDQIRGFLAVEEMTEMRQDNYFNFSLFNKEVSYDVNLNNVGCSCNAALFFTSMPGHNADGSIAHGSLNPYYCDANKVGGVWCWEHDVMEANKYAMATTPHTCNAAPGEYTTKCDGVGCSGNTLKIDPKGMCPDAGCKIDTRRVFRINQKFIGDASLTKLVRISNSITQGNNTFDWDACHDAAYLEQMTAPLKANMTMVFQLWGDTWENMDWLDKESGCTEACNVGTTEATFSNIAINTLPVRIADADLIVI